MDVVIRTPHGEAEVRIGAHHPGTRLVDVLEAVTGRVVPPVVDVDDRAVPSVTPLEAAGVLVGSVIEVGATTRDDLEAAVVDLVQIAGWGTTTRAALAPGTYRIGPGRRVNAPELAIAPVDTVGFEVRVGVDGAVSVSAGSDGVRLDGMPLAPGRHTPWTTGVVDVLGRAFVVTSHVGRAPGRPRPSWPSGRATFNRPPLPAPAPPVAAVIPRPDVDRSGRRHHGRREGEQHEPDVESLRRAERERRRHAAALPTDAADVARTAAPTLWRARTSDAEPMELVVGLGDEPWGPADARGGHGSLAMVPVSVDLARERGLAIVGSTEFVRATARGIVMAAAITRGPSDLAVVVATHADRVGTWEWLKWLPHCRTTGTIDVLTAADAIASVIEAAARADAPTLVIADEPMWWRERSAPLRALLVSDRSPVHLLALVGDAADAPTVCTTLLTEHGDGAVLDRLLDRRSVPGVLPFLVPADAALTAARYLAGLDDPDLAPPEDDPAHRRAPVHELLQLGDTAGGPLAGRVIDRWSGGDRAPTLLPVGRDRGVTITLELDRHGPHVVVAGPEAPDAIRGLVVGLAVVAAPDEVGIVLIGPPATFGACADLPHVVGAVAHPDGRDAERVLRCLRAELRRRASAADSARSRLVVVLDEPTARDVAGFAQAVTAIARDGAAHGMHLVIATDRPATAFDDELGPMRVARLQVASRLGELTTRPRARSTLRVGVGHPVEIDPVTSRAPSAQPPPPDAPEIAPFVVGRDLTPMERRLAKGGHADDSARTPGAVDALVAAIGRASTETGRVPPRACIPPALADTITLDELLATHDGDGVPWAVADLPDEQRHAIRSWMPRAGGSLLVTGGRGVAASWPIATLVLGLAARTAADDIEVHVVGDGSGALDELARLAHVRECTGTDRLEDVAATLARLAETVSARRELAARSRSRRRAVEPVLVLMIDDIGGLRLRLRARVDLSGAWTDLERIVRFGGDVGVVAVAVARDRNDLPPDLELAFTTRLVVDDATGAPVGRAVDVSDGDTLVQLAEPPPSLRHAVDEMTAAPDARQRGGSATGDQR